MRKSSNKATPPGLGRDLDCIGDHLALDFINTVCMVGGEKADKLRSDGDVRRWLDRAGMFVAAAPARWSEGRLLAAAHRLRDLALNALRRRKAGELPPLDDLNGFLADALGHGALVAEGRAVTLRRIYPGRTPHEYLAPVAEAVADLIANAEIGLVRQCEGEGCVLWFYDRTKSHHRRFCSAAGCGNRAKVAAFRARQPARAPAKPERRSR